jgi:hypothetical protein
VCVRPNPLDSNSMQSLSAHARKPALPQCSENHHVTLDEDTQFWDTSIPPQAAIPPRAVLRPRAVLVRVSGYVCVCVCICLYLRACPSEEPSSLPQPSIRQKWVSQPPTPVLPFLDACPPGCGFLKKAGGPNNLLRLRRLENSLTPPIWVSECPRLF